MGPMTMLIIQSLLLLVIIAVGIFFVIRYFIKYNAKQKRKHSEHSEMDKMKIDDLE